jgi:CheY-like chemotaxis protein
MDKSISVLVVEDEEHIRDARGYNLKLDGFQVHLAGNGPGAIELARRLQPDAILLERMMPDMDGLEALRELKRDKTTRDIPVFVLTAKATAADIAQALREAADDYITKAFDLMQLGRMIVWKLRKCASRNPVG